MLCFYHSFIIERMLYILQYARFWVRAGAWLIDCVLAVGLHFSSAWIFGDGSHEVAAGRPAGIRFVSASDAADKAPGHDWKSNF